MFTELPYLSRTIFRYSLYHLQYLAVSLFMSTCTSSVKLHVFRFRLSGRKRGLASRTSALKTYCTSPYMYLKLGTYVILSYFFVCENSRSMSHSFRHTRWLSWWWYKSSSHKLHPTELYNNCLSARRCHLVKYVHTISGNLQEGESTYC